ncbi:thaumatin-like protein isoform X1 [Musa acuminata AAA Group]|uniref:thaumatin-like protein isoform X1 n=1 Tax=Musa acuminata AAA Group TaxID=214697 RepID=UPI0031E2A98E
MATHKAHLFVFCLCSLTSVSFAGQIQLILVNNCNYSVWPGTLGNAGHLTPKDGGFHLARFEEAVIDVPEGWSGRIWGRTGCCFDEHGGGYCDTGDCGRRLHCMGKSGAPPASVVEMTLGTAASSLHFYDVSLVEGFNLPVTMAPVGGGIGCGVAGCEADVTACCPAEFEVRRGRRVVGCKSACLALKADEYCCTGRYGSPTSCKPTRFSHLFKSICPRAYSYAFDDPTSLKKCRASRYLITFCPPQH